jgi:hypothetical protein
MRVYAEYDVYEVFGSLVSGDREGDTSEPGLSRVIPDYFEDITITMEGVDVTEDLRTEVRDACEQALFDALEVS